MSEGLQFDGVGFRFSSGGSPVLEGIDLSVGAPELVVIVGASGSGKSTLLRLVAGFARPTAGSISLAGSPLDTLEPRQRDVGMVFQDYALYPHLTVAENLAFPLRARGLAKAAALARAAETAARLHLTDVLARLPRDLSGGQRQRVALGRLLVRSPRVALFDEPLSNLDVALRRELRAEIRALHDANRWTTLYVTHDPMEAAALGDRIAVLHHGSIVQVGRFDDLTRDPRHREVAALLCPSLNFARAELLPPSWRRSSRAFELAMPAERLAITNCGTGTLPATYLGALDNAAGASHGVVRTAWGAQWIASSSLSFVIGASVSVNLNSPEAALQFTEEGWRVDTCG